MNENQEKDKATPVAPQATTPTTGTSLDEIRAKQKQREEGEYVTLPSGIVLRLKRPSLSFLLRHKKIPSSLVGAALRMSQAKEPTNSTEISENIMLMETVLQVAIVEPEGMTEADIQALDDEDKGVAFLYIQQGVTDLESFRNKLSRQATR